MTSAIDVASQDGGNERDPFAGERIELEDGQLRRASGHVVWLGRFKRRLNEITTALTYGR